MTDQIDTPNGDDGNEAPIDTESDEAQLDIFDKAIGRPRDPDRFSGYLDALFIKAGRRRVTFGVVAAVLSLALLVTAIWAVRNDAGIGGLTSSEANFELVESDGFDEIDSIDATDHPDLSTSATAPIDQLTAVTTGTSPRIERVVVDPDPELFVISPDDVYGSLLTFRSVPAVALSGPAAWYNGTCIEISVLDETGEPSAPVWVAAELGACQGQAGGQGVVPKCAGPDVIIVSLPEPSGEATGDDSGQRAVTVSVFSPDPGYEALLVSGTIAVTEPSPRWPAAIADDGAEVQLTGLPSGTGETQASCLVG